MGDFPNVLVGYGHSELKVDTNAGRQLKMKTLPAGFCVVTVQTHGEPARFAVQQAFHAFCKKANDRSGAAEHTALTAPHKNSGSIEEFLNNQPYVQAYCDMPVTLHVANGDWGGLGAQTPEFTCIPYAGSGRKSGLHKLDTAGNGEWSYDLGDEPNLEAVLKSFEGAYFPSRAYVTDKVAAAGSWLPAGPGGSNPSAKWDELLQTFITYELDNGRGGGLLNKEKGERTVFYQLACRVYDDSGYSTRGLAAPGRAASGAHVDEVARLQPNLANQQALRRQRWPQLKNIVLQQLQQPPPPPPLPTPVTIKFPFVVSDHDGAKAAFWRYLNEELDKGLYKEIKEAALAPATWVKIFSKSYVPPKGSSGGKRQNSRYRQKRRTPRRKHRTTRRARS
jgi:hypothetical protein